MNNRRLRTGTRFAVFRKQTISTNSRPVRYDRRSSEGVMMSDKPRSKLPILDRLRRAQTAIAYAMKLDGPVYAPLFERLEREIASLRAADDVMARARRCLESQDASSAIKVIPTSAAKWFSAQPATCYVLEPVAIIRQLSQLCSSLAK